MMVIQFQNIYASDELAKIAKPTLVITGTDDRLYILHIDSLIIASKIL